MHSDKAKGTLSAVRRRELGDGQPRLLPQLHIASAGCIGLAKACKMRESSIRECTERRRANTHVVGELRANECCTKCTCMHRCEAKRMRMDEKG